ncbi:MAG: hypothetical protein ACREPT_13325, partial [Rudaea sp.]
AKGFDEVKQFPGCMPDINQSSIGARDHGYQEGQEKSWRGKKGYEKSGEESNKESGEESGKESGEEERARTCCKSQKRPGACGKSKVRAWTCCKSKIVRADKVVRMA